METVKRVAAASEERGSCNGEKGKRTEEFFPIYESDPGSAHVFKKRGRNSASKSGAGRVDNPSEPAWQVERILELLVPKLNLLYVLTDRPEYFRELSEEVFEEQGLLMTVTDSQEIRRAGNLIMDLCDWEMHLDIIS